MKVLRAIKQLFGHLSLAAILLDWELKSVCWNEAAVRFCEHCRRVSPKVEADYNGGDQAPAPPGRILAVCRGLKTDCNALPEPATPPMVKCRVRGLMLPERVWWACVGVIRLEAAPLGRPMFLIEIEEERARFAASPDSASLARLTICEREVARLVGTGCSNGEIARQLDKSIMTVKKQLQSIYQKLEISSRGRLIALIH